MALRIADQIGNRPVQILAALFDTAPPGPKDKSELQRPRADLQGPTR